MKKLFALIIAGSLSIASLAGADDHDRRVFVHNVSGTSVFHLYGSNVGTNSWESDILGEDVLRDGKIIRVNFDDGTGHCLFDIKVVFSDDTVAYKHRFNVCEQSNLYIRH